jgi:ribosomal protein L13E
MKQRQILVRSFRDAQLIQTGINAVAGDGVYRTDIGVIPSPAGSAFDDGYVLTDAPMPVVRKAARMHNVTIPQQRRKGGGFTISKRNQAAKPRKFVALRRAGVTVAKVNARRRRAVSKRNPLPKGKVLRESFTLSTLRAVRQGGRVEKVWYEDARDGQHYYHDFDGEQGAIMYLCESAAVGKCVLIVAGDLSTPLWEDA